MHNVLSLTQARSRDLAGGVALDAHIAAHHERFRVRYGDRPFSRFGWQSSFYDRIIRTSDELVATLNYVTHNYIKHGLSTDWRYTSANFPDLLDVL